MGSRFTAYARLLRLSGLIGFSIAPVFGALSEVGLNINCFTLLLLFMLGVFKSIHGFVMNDIFDIEVDRLSDNPDRRPLVNGDISKKTAYIFSIVTIILTFVVLFTFFYSTLPTFWYVVVIVILSAIIGNFYNKFSKRIMGLDVLVGFSEALFVLIGAFLVTLNTSLNIITWVIFFLVFFQYLFMNMIIGGLKDADHDYLYKTKNIAMKTGVKVSKDKTLFLTKSFIAIGLSIRLISASLMLIPFLFFNISFKLWEVGFIIIVVGIVLILTIKIFLLKEITNKKRILGLFAVQGVLRYSYVPILLISVIGLFNSLLLIILPILWFIIITAFSGQDIAPNL